MGVKELTTNKLIGGKELNNILKVCNLKEGKKRQCKKKIDNI